jgi:AAHS family 4-hydroxybenzoate transporter-like MFS transporter
MGPVQLKVVGLCLLVMLIDGYDLFMIGLALPAIAADFGVTPADLTSVVVAQNVGLALGTFIAGPLSDRFGRKLPLVISVAAFGLLTLATTQVSSIEAFVVVRLLTGVFCAAVIPNAVALTNEMTPARWRSGFVALIFCGYAGGTSLGSFVNGYLLQSHEWHLIFWIGGVLALGLLVPLIMWLPESLRFRVQRDPGDPEIPRIANRLLPAPAPPDATWFSSVGQTSGAQTRSSIVELFTGGRAAMTLLLWLLFTLSFILNTSLAAWSATVFNVGAGLPIATAGAMIGIFSLAGVAGTGTSGFIMGRFGAGKTLFALYAGSLLAMVALAFADYQGALVYVAIAAAGYCFVGGQGALNAFAASSYPTKIRATGVGWAFGTGRLGAIIGPLIGGAMIAAGFGVTAFFLALSIPLFAIICLIPLTMAVRNRASPTAL